MMGEASCEPTERNMPRFLVMVMAALIIGVLVPAMGSAQTAAPSPPSPNSTAPVTGMRPDRTTADPAMRQRMQRREAALRANRLACRKEARAQKISVFKRRSFVRQCMAR
jgi:hypothetical protein